MKTIFTRLVAVSLFTATIFTACSKNETLSELNNAPQQTTANAINPARETPYILDQDLRVTYARDGATDITEQMNDWTFRFEGNYPSGVAQAWNDILARTGSWAMAENSNTINIAYPAEFSQLIFMSKQWTIGEVTRGEEIVFTSADGDEVHFISKTQ